MGLSYWKTWQEEKNRGNVSVEPQTEFAFSLLSILLRACSAHQHVSRQPICASQYCWITHLCLIEPCLRQSLIRFLKPFGRIHRRNDETQNLVRKSRLWEGGERLIEER